MHPLRVLAGLPARRCLLVALSIFEIGLGPVLVGRIEFPQDVTQRLRGSQARLEKVAKFPLGSSRPLLNEGQCRQKHGGRLPQVMARGADALQHNPLPLPLAHRFLGPLAIADVDERAHHPLQFSLGVPVRSPRGL